MVRGGYIYHYDVLYQHTFVFVNGHGRKGWIGRNGFVAFAVDTRSVWRRMLIQSYEHGTLECGTGDCSRIMRALGNMPIQGSGHGTRRAAMAIAVE